MHPKTLLQKRLWTALILIPLVIIAVLKVSDLFWCVLTGYMIALGAWEWTALLGWQAWQKRLGYVLCLLGIGILVIVYRHWVLVPSLVLSIASAWWLCAIGLIIDFQKRPQRRYPTWLTALFGLYVLPPAWLGLVLLRPKHVTALLLILVLIWVADTAAYFSGRRWGKHHLANHVSPGKTLEGWLGACLVTWCVAAGLIYGLNPQATFSMLILGSLITALLINSFGLIGDLFESLLKRQVGIKDSGKFLPGHGGLLDRIDSLLAIIPVITCLIWFSH